MDKNLVIEYDDKFEVELEEVLKNKKALVHPNKSIIIKKKYGSESYFTGEKGKIASAEEAQNEYEVIRSVEDHSVYSQAENNFADDSYRIKEFELMFIDINDFEKIIYFENEDFIMSPVWQTPYSVRAALRKEKLPTSMFMTLPDIYEEYIFDDAMKQAYIFGQISTFFSLIKNNELEYASLAHNLLERSNRHKVKFIKKKRKEKTGVKEMSCGTDSLGCLERV